MPLTRTKLKTSINIIEGDTVTVSYTTEQGENQTASVHEARKEDEMEIDVCGVFKFENDFDCSHGIGGYFGKEK